MKKMGFFGLAFAATVTGEVTVPPSEGLATVRGKSFEPFGAGGVQLDVGGVQAGGAGYLLLDGCQVTAIGGIDGYDGCAVVGVVPVVVVLVPVPQATEPITAAPTIRVERDALLILVLEPEEAASALILDTPQHVQYGTRITRAGGIPGNRKVGSQLSFYSIQNEGSERIPRLP